MKMEKWNARQQRIIGLAAKRFLDRISGGKPATDVAMGVYVSCGELAVAAMQALVVERIMKS